MTATIKFDVPEDEYRRGDKIPRLTQSLAKTLLTFSPRHTWLECPALNPVWQEDDDKKFDIGNIAHSLLIGRGKRVQMIDADDWRTKAAKEEREALKAQGILGVLRKHHTTAEIMVDCAKIQLAEYREFDLMAALKDCSGEVVVEWVQRAFYPFKVFESQMAAVAMKTMIDLLSEKKRLVIDYKTVGQSANPVEIPRVLTNFGWDVQAATHKMALDTVDPENAGRRTHLFIAQESFPPYALTVAEITEAVMTIGTKKLLVAMEIWQECIESGNWPMYPARILRPEYPEWAENAWLKREMEEFGHEDH